MGVVLEIKTIFTVQRPAKNPVWVPKTEQNFQGVKKIQVPFATFLISRDHAKDRFGDTILILIPIRACHSHMVAVVGMITGL